MFVRNVLMFSGLVMVGAALTPSLKADQWDKKTTLTVNEPIQLPACCTPDHTIVLQPGEYVLKLVDSPSDRHIVQVFDKDEQHVITTILAIPNYRLQPTGKTAFGFWETPPGQPRALRAWFYPGDNFGQEFAYQKTRAIEIARVAKAPVPVVVADTEVDLKTAALAVVDESGNEAPLKLEAPLVAQAEPTRPAAEPVIEQAPTTAPVSEPVPATLPHTASYYPLIGLIGLASLAFAVGISRLANRA
jgi:hypothetical protein